VVCQIETEKPDVPGFSQILNTRYFGATWNSPFDRYHSEHRYSGFGKSHELHNANGFVITVESTSTGKRVAAAAAASAGR
jgi:hypothetical protein